jgi:hypothetical protein
VISVTLRPRFIPFGTHWIRGCVRPRAGLDAGVRRKILCPCRGSNPDRPARSQTLYCLSYRGCEMSTGLCKKKGWNCAAQHCSLCFATSSCQPQIQFLSHSLKSTVFFTTWRKLHIAATPIGVSVSPPQLSGEFYFVLNVQLPPTLQSFKSSLAKTRVHDMQSDRKVTQPFPDTRYVCEKTNHIEIIKQNTMLY